MIITVFEDLNKRSLFPLNLTRASFELRCGAFTNLERIENIIQPGDSIHLIVRDQISAIVREKFPKYPINQEKILKGIWLNGTGLWNEEEFRKLSSGKSFKSNDCFSAVYSEEDVALSEFYTHLKWWVL